MASPFQPLPDDSDGAQTAGASPGGDPSGAIYGDDGGAGPTQSGSSPLLGMDSGSDDAATTADA